MARAVSACVHCGFCLPACPTYAVLGEEMDSPRGRIVLMKEALEGRLESATTEPFIDRCLGCLACEPACPSGVAYGELVTPYRAWLESRRRRGLGERVARWLAHETLPFPGRVRASARLAAPARWIRRFLPSRLRAMLDLLPRRLPPRAVLPRLVRAIGERRARVVALPGCAQSVFAPEIHVACVEVLTRNGIEVETLERAGCCGALAHHSGLEKRAKRFARRVLGAVRDLEEAPDFLVSSAAGCGSAIKEYPILLAGEHDESEARDVAARCRDVSELLDELGFVERPCLRAPLRVAYQDACHLAHAQGVSAAPRRLLGQVDGLELVLPQDAHLCCGSAGTYNFEEPVIANELGERKVDALLALEPDLIATGNIGCLLQMRATLARRGSRIPVMHTFEVLARAVRETSG